MASFPVNDFTEGAWKSNKNHKFIMRPGGADSVKSRQYSPIIVRSSPACNILDILVLLYKIFVNYRLNLVKLHKKYMKRMSRHVDG